MIVGQDFLAAGDAVQWPVPTVPWMPPEPTVQPAGAHVKLRGDLVHGIHGQLWCGLGHLSVIRREL
jgi:hypothetical protein